MGGETTVVRLREALDDLVGKNASGEVAAADFVHGVRRIISDCHGLLERKGVPQEVALHARQLIAEGYGAISEHEKALRAHVALLESISRYYASSGTKGVGSEAERTSGVGDTVVWGLVARADEHQESGQYLAAIAYHEEAQKRGPPPDAAAYSLYRMGLCYAAYDLPEGVDACHRALVTHYPRTPWAIGLLQARAAALAKEKRTWIAATDAYARIADLAGTSHDACMARLAAAGIMLKAGQYARAHETISEAVLSAAGDGDRALARQVTKYALIHEFRASERNGVAAFQ
jgi:tetratricopeptide (TPR) repeat protein